MSKLLLDSRWTRRERQAYDKFLRAGYFAECVRILQKHMTPQQIADAKQRANEFEKLFGLYKP